MNSEFIKRAELLEALDKVAEDARERASWNYDTLACLKLDAKAEVCEELKTLLTLPEPSIAAQSRALRFAGLVVDECTCEPKTGMFDPRCPVHYGRPR